ncbi:NAD(P)-dependent oxidoreductase [Falsiroseomonas sp. HW251]|uniref:NAD(P)-dependent oxidoreductase n=1 Tax=Falsiroseomonas sp. HW251 TaxID=3390998 RepID=UPI003D31C9B1
MVVAASRLTAAHLAAGDRLRFVQHQGVGWQDTVAWQEVAARGIPLATTPQGTTVPVAEMALLMTLAALRRLPHADAELRRGAWHVNALRPVSRNLAGRVVGYVGFGRIGQATAARFAAFDTTGLYFDPITRLSAEDATRLRVRRAETLQTLLAEAEIVSLHLPLTLQTQHILDAAAIRCMRPGSVLVNTARGGLVDEAALAAALRDGHLLAAALDVFEEEPPSPGHPLLALPNVVLTPHISAGTRDAFEEKLSAAFGNVADFFAGRPARNLVALPALA